MKITKYKILLLALFFLSVFPPLLLTVAILVTGNIDARWLAIPLAPIQIGIWILFVLAAAVGIFIYLLKREYVQKKSE